MRDLRIILVASALAEFGRSTDSVNPSTISCNLMPICLIDANELEVAKMQNFGDVIAHLENQDHVVSGSSLEEIVSLSETVLGKKRKPVFVKETSLDKTQFYLFDMELCQQMATLEYEQLLNLSVPWSETDYWRNKVHNRFDLAGYLLDISAISKRTVEHGNLLYVVVENE